MMSDEMKATIEAAIRELLSAVQTGADFAKEQIPLILQEKLTYDLYKALFSIAFWLLLGVAAYIWCAFWVKRAKAEYNDSAGYYLLAGIPITIAAIIALIVIPDCVLTVLQISIAPRLYLLEWLRGLV